MGSLSGDLRLIVYIPRSHPLQRGLSYEPGDFWRLFFARLRLTALWNDLGNVWGTFALRPVALVALFTALSVLGIGTNSAQAADFAYRLSGIEGALLENVEAQLSSLGLDDVTVPGRYRAQIRAGVKTGLKALGYYEPEVKLTWERRAAQDNRANSEKGAPSDATTSATDEPSSEKKNTSSPQVLLVTVKPGEPVRIAGAELCLEGEAADDPDFKKLQEKLPQKGRILHHGEYDTFKKEVTALGTRKGYFQGRFTRSELAVATSRREAWWRLTYESGPRWRFGETSFTGSQIDHEILEQIVPFKPGDPYLSDTLAQLNENLADTGWFSSAVVVPDFRNADAEHRLPLIGAITPRKANIMELGAGYSTDVGPRFTGTWTKPWVNSSGHSLTISTSLSQKEPELDFSYRVPVKKNPLEEYWLYQGGFKYTDLNDTRSKQTSFLVSRNWNFSTGWQRAVSLRWLNDNYTQGETDENTMLLYPGISVRRTRSRGGAMPTWGDSQHYSIDVSNGLWGSDTDFWAVNASGTLIRTFRNRHRFVGRYTAGWIEATSFTDVPPDLRYFAGGDRSIRGYDYKSIAPKDSSGDLRGAKRLLTASLEYQWNFSGDWWVAVFADSGEAVDRFNTTDIKTGAGLGIRWKSPVGPVKFDIARPVGDDEHHSFAFYIGLGPEL